MLPLEQPDRIYVAFDEPPGGQCRTDPAGHLGPPPGTGSWWTTGAARPHLRRLDAITLVGDESEEMRPWWPMPD